MLIRDSLFLVQYALYSTYMTIISGIWRDRSIYTRLTLGPKDIEAHRLLPERFHSTSLLVIISLLPTQHFANGPAAGATHFEPLAPPLEIGASATWQHHCKHRGLRIPSRTSWHYAPTTSSLFLQHGAHGRTDSTPRDTHYIHTLNTPNNHGTTSTFPTFSTPTTPSCHKTHSQSRTTSTFNKTSPHQPDSWHSSTTSHTQNSRTHSSTTPIKSTKTKESLTKLRRLHKPSLIVSGAVQTIAAHHCTEGNPTSSHRTNSHSGTRTLTTGKPYGHHPSSLVISRRRDPHQPEERLQGTPELGFSWRKNAPNAVRVQGKMAAAPPATDSTFGDYAAAASYITNPGPPRPPTPHP